MSCQSKMFAVLALVVLSLHIALAAHSQCYYWRHKGYGGALKPSYATLMTEEQVLAASESRRKGKSHPTSDHSLRRRNTPTIPSIVIAGGPTSACGSGYDSNKVLGGCLWTGNLGPSSQDPYSGWLNGAHTDNCGKQIYVESDATGTQAVYANVVDGCTISDSSISEDVGCAALFVTEALFKALGGQEGQSSVQVNSWDFVNDSDN